jgi:hypothetical protein
MTSSIMTLLALMATRPGAMALKPTTISEIHVEAGAIVPLSTDRFEVRDPGLRAIVPGSSGERARVSFEYHGATRQLAPLASGEPRRQIGLKLRAQDTCNIVYVMWHIAPTQGIFVQVKANPGQKTHIECKDHGYRTVSPELRREVRPIRAGEPRALEASIENGRLRVLVDDVLVWEGKLPEDQIRYNGPAGVRTDNAELTVSLLTLREHAKGERP